jgi:type IV secretory pathway TrbL component
MASATAVATQASRVLVHKALMKGSLSSASQYQRSEKPSGGKRRLSPGVKDVAITITAGSASVT